MEDWDRDIFILFLMEYLIIAGLVITVFLIGGGT